MNTNLVVHAAALSKISGNAQLREGSSVFVRVLKNNGNNSYIVAFSGGRFSIKSEVALKEGSGFAAKIKISDGKIFLQKTDNKAFVSEPLQKLTAEGQKTFLENLGLIPDNISLSLFRQMKELGQKFNLSIFNKARRTGLSFRGKEKQASEIAYILESKGISSDEDYVEALLDENSENNEEIDSSALYNSSGSDGSFEDFFVNLLKGSKQVKNPSGLLTLFNHMGFNFKAGENLGNWVKIPFEFENSHLKGNGTFCAFIKNSLKKTDRATIEFNLGDKKYFFGVCTGQGKISSLQAGCTDEDKKRPLLESLRSTFPEIDVEYIQPENFSNFMPQNDEIEIFRGFA